MDKITYDNVNDKLLQKFPEYRNSEKYYDDVNKELPYIVLGNLCLMAFENIDKKSEYVIAERLVKFSDEIFNNPNSDDKLVNLFAVEVLENITGSKTGAKLAKSLLHGKSVEILEQTLKHYHTDEFLEEYRKK